MSALDSSFRFRLRKEVVSDGRALRDPITGAVYPLDDLGRTIAETMNAPLTAEELVSQVAGAWGASRAEVERALRQMLLLGLLEDTCSASRERLERIRGGDRLTPRVLEGSRFGCQNSGACCRGYVFGSIRAEEKARIEALNPHMALRQLGDHPLFIEAGTSSGKPTYRLATVGDACVFLEEGPRCGLHRAFGAGAKPALCQLYPLAAVATIEGLKIYDRGECATFAVSARTGTLLEDDVPRIRALVDEEIYHPTVQVHGSWRCDYGLVLALARRLEEEANSSSPLQALHAIGHVARGFVVTLARCPFEAGQPETAVAAALARSAAEFLPAEASVATNARAGLRALAALAEGLAERVASTEALGPSFIKAASLLAEICRGALGEAILSDGARAALAISIEADCERAMKLSLRQQLFGRELLLDDQLPAGLLRMAFVVTLTLAGARLRALDDGRKHVLPQHFSASHMTTKRTLHRPEPHGLLRANGEQAWPILDALPLLARDLGSERT
jgi:Fe-S-cluster containining protein